MWTVQATGDPGSCYPEPFSLHGAAVCKCSPANKANLNKLRRTSPLKSPLSFKGMKVGKAHSSQLHCSYFAFAPEFFLTETGPKLLTCQTGEDFLGHLTHVGFLSFSHPLPFQLSALCFLSASCLPKASSLPILQRDRQAEGRRI